MLAQGKVDSFGSRSIQIQATPQIWTCRSAITLTDLDATKRLRIFLFQFRTSPLHSSVSSSSSSRTLLTSFFPHSVTQRSFDFPGSAFLCTAYRPACWSAGRIPGLWLSTHISFCTHTRTHTYKGGNKLMEWAVLSYYLWRKVYCFLLQRVELIYWHIPKCPNAIDLLLSDQSGEICVFF